jgi:SAM-dependent methyltransferase
MSRKSYPRPPVDPASLNPTPETMWTNLGYWPGATSYVEAARELARRVGQAAQLRPGDVVLDYACGYGDSLKLWVEEFGVARVVGVEPDPSVTSIVARRVAEWGLADRVSVITARAEEVMPSELVPRANAVVCVDAAYHFADLRGWLGRVARALPKGGRVGFCGVEFSDGAAGSWLVRGMVRIAGIPKENVSPAAGAREVLMAAGSTVCSSDEAGSAVLDGFARGASSRGVPLRLTRAGICLLRIGAVARYRIVGAAVT